MFAYIGTMFRKVQMTYRTTNSLTVPGFAPQAGFMGQHSMGDNLYAPGFDFAFGFFNDDFVEKAKEADGFVFGSPVHFASASGAITSFMDRAFYGKGAVYVNKPGAAIMSCRRGGSTATLDQLNKYFTISSTKRINYSNG